MRRIIADAARLGARFLFLEQAERDIAIGREANLLAFNAGNEAFGEIMMVAFVAALAAVLPGQLDPVALHLVDRADMNAIGADHFHMLANVLETAHLFLLQAASRKEQMSEADRSAAIARFGLICGRV
jgi:hypothetical protein